MIWCMFPKIWSATDIIFFHLGPFFALLPPNNPKNENGKNGKKAWRYHLFTQVYKKSWSYAILFLRYGMRRIQLLFFILGNFLPFYPPPSPFPPQKKIKKMKKKPLEIPSFNTSVPKIMIMCYTVPEIRCRLDVIVIFHFGLFFALLSP